MEPVLDKPLKTFWSEKNRQSYTFLCPLCKTSRAVPYEPRPGRLRHYAQIGLTSVVFMIATWYWFSWKGIVSFVPMWAVFEFLFRSRMRVDLSCPHCGFDPYLYMTDIQRAREQIDTHWRKKFADKGIPYPEKNGQAKGSNAARKTEQNSKVMPSQSEASPTDAN